jgi:hypothetical protein
MGLEKLVVAAERCTEAAEALHSEVVVERYIAVNHRLSMEMRYKDWPQGWDRRSAAEV